MILRELEADERLAGAGGVDDGGLAGVVEHGEGGAIGYLVVANSDIISRLLSPCSDNKTTA